MLELQVMHNYRSLILTVFLLFVGATGAANAQILSVTGEYRVTNVDRAGQRFGIALRDANPNKRQNWVYVKPGTRIVRRIFLPGGVFRDEIMSFNGFFDYARKGTLLKVEGGRAWDKSIHAKKIWM